MVTSPSNTDVMIMCAGPYVYCMTLANNFAEQTLLYFTANTLAMFYFKALYDSAAYAITYFWFRNDAFSVTAM